MNTHTTTPIAAAILDVDTLLVTSPRTSALELSVVVPTYDERENVVPLIDSLKRCLRNLEWEVIFVDDDSQDGTAQVLHDVARRDSRVRCLRRIGRRGLASACIEGMMASAAPYVAVMDADLQHDETLLPVMLARLRSSDLDIVVGSRYIAGGSTDDWSEDRKVLSRIATALSRVVLRADLADPMSGYFMIRREPMYACVRTLTGLGYKILLDLFSSSPTPLRYAELPLGFRPRTRGESKLDATVGWEYALMLVDKLIGHVVPVRFVAFTLVGSLGVLVHLSVLTAAMSLVRASFLVSHAVATFVAMTFNFALNNVLTYRDRRLKGWQLLTGWVSFTLACGIGALANVGVAGYLFNQRTYWLWSALAGVLVGAVWNYAVTAVYTWNKRD